VAVTRSAGGLDTALACLHAERGSLRMGWPGEACRSATTWQCLEPQLRDEYWCAPVFLRTRDIHHYDDGGKNRAFWPLFQVFQAHLQYDEARSRDASPEGGRQRGGTEP
jgi:trehalose-6-phosphate synthase